MIFFVLGRDTQPSIRKCKYELETAVRYKILLKMYARNYVWTFAEMVIMYNRNNLQICIFI